MGFYNYQKPTEATNLGNDLYPFLMEYHHELNPAYLFNILNPDLIDLFPVITVRDGALILANFILKYFQQIPSMKTHFFIHKDLAHLVPSNLRNHFSAWNIVQTNQIKPQDAKKILITGIISDATVYLNELTEKMQSLGPISPLTQIEVYLPQRQNPFGMPWTESNLTPKTTEILKEYLPENKINYLKTKDLLDSTNFHSAFCLDLMSDSIIVTDTFVNHFLAARGCSTTGFKSNPVSNSFHEIDLSLHHKIQYFPLPEVTSIFPDLVFYKKQAGVKDILADLGFHTLLKKQNF